MSQHVVANRRGAQTRAELLEAAWRLVDRMSLVDLLEGLTPARVAAEAGRTTGAFHYHFPTTEALVEAMVDHLLDHRPTTELEVLEAVLREEDAGVDLIRAAAEADWAIHAEPNVRAASLREALVENRASLTVFPDGSDLRSKLDEGWRRFLTSMVPLYDRFLEATDRSMVPPLDTARLARVLSALTDGLYRQSILQPTEVDDELYASLISMLATALTTPASRRASLEDVELELRRSIPVPAGADRLQEIAIAVADLFEVGVPAVTFSQIGQCAGISAREVAEMFGTVRRVAAVSFAEFLPDLVRSANRHRRTDPSRALCDVLCDIARGAQRRPTTALSLLRERAEANLGLPEPTGIDIRFVVPIALCVMTPLAEVPGVRWEDVPATSANLIDVCLLLGSTRPNLSPAEIAASAVGMLGPRISSFRG